MLKIQEFILAHTDWKELLSQKPYNLKITELDDMVMFKYSQISSDFNLEICKEARGLILQKGSWKVLRYAFYKFFNYEEPFATKIDWDNCEATLKIDGSLISVFYHNGWRVATNGCISADLAELNEEMNFRQLFNIAAINSNFDFDKLDPHYCYTFELVSPFNKVVIQYNEPKLYHISTRDMRNLKEEEVDIGVEKPKAYKLDSKEDYEELVKAFDKNKEGIVIKDLNGNRVKMKTESYFLLHKIRSKAEVHNNLVEVILKNEQSELLSYFPEYKEKITEIESKIESIKFIFEEAIDFAKEAKALNMERKKYAALVAERAEHIPKFQFAFFLAYDGKLESKIENATVKDWITWTKEE